MGEIVDCNQDKGHTGELCKKIYRISPKGASMQYTIRCDYRNSVTKENGEASGIYPMLIQSKYRIDEKRQMTPDGKEKKPWSKFFKIQKLFYHCLRNRLLKLENEFDSYLYH